MSFNEKLAFLDPQLFENLKQLKVINLRFCFFKVMDFQRFCRLPNIQQVDFTDNAYVFDNISLPKIFVY